MRNEIKLGNINPGVRAPMSDQSDDILIRKVERKNIPFSLERKVYPRFPTSPPNPQPNPHRLVAFKGRPKVLTDYESQLVIIVRVTGLKA